MNKLGVANIHGEGYMYKRTLLMLLMALPLFVTGAKLSWNHADGAIDRGSSPTSRSGLAAAEQPDHLADRIIAARDEQTEQCRWLGTCPK